MVHWSSSLISQDTNRSLHPSTPSRRLRVLVLSKYGSLAASPRYRFLQFADTLQEAGIDLVFSPLLDNDYLNRRLTDERVDMRAALRGVFRRIRDMRRSSEPDLLWIHCELIPFLPFGVERILLAPRINYVFDFDDAIFHTYDQHRYRLVRWLLGNKLSSLIRNATAVTAGSPYLVDYSRRYNDNVHFAPTVVDLAQYDSAKPDSTGTFSIVWVGSPSSTPYLELIGPALVRLAQEIPLRLIAVGARVFELDNVDIEIVPWSEQNERRCLAKAHVGVMPLRREPWAEGKCSFKIIQYMACGLPVVASPVGMNTTVVTAECGFLAEGDDQWIATLRELSTRPDLRRRLGQVGQDRARRLYSKESVAPLLARVLRAAGEGRGRD